MSIKTYIKGHSGVALFVCVLVVIFAVVGGRLATKKPAEDSLSNTKRVSLVSVSMFRDDLSTVGVEGIVESASQVDLRSQVSAPIAQVYVSIGDSVAQGQTLVEFQNADIRAQLEQARANLALAQGEYTTGGVSIDSASKTSIDTLRTTYIKAESAFSSEIGQFLFSSNPNTLQLQSLLTDSKIGNDLSLQWTETQASLRTFKESVDSLNDTSNQEQIVSVIAVAQKSLAVLSNFLDTVSAALVNASNGANQENLASINSWKQIASTARATTNASISSLTSTRASLSTNKAQISAAQAGVRNLEAQLAKTIIKAPIAGTIAALPLRVGELATPGQLITTIVGSGGLQIKAFASREDVNRIAKDSLVTIEGSIPGVVTNVSPSVDPTTKKVEVTISVPSGERAHLVVGQSIQAKIQTSMPANKGIATQPNYMFPIQDIKIVPDAAYVYTVDENSKIIKHQVVLGEVQGDFVEVKSGITEDMKIVSPVYELEEGETVTIQ